MSLALAPFRLCAPVLGGVLLAGLVGLQPAAAKIEFDTLFLARYRVTGTRLDSCNVCHTDGGGSPRNAYGLAFLKGGTTSKALAQLEKQDPDGDGVASIIELRLGTFPGDPQDTPAPAAVNRLQAGDAFLEPVWTALAGSQSASIFLFPLLADDKALGTLAQTIPTSRAEWEGVRVATWPEAKGRLLLGTPAPELGEGWRLGAIREADGKLGRVLALDKQGAALELTERQRTQVEGGLKRLEWAGARVAQGG